LTADAKTLINQSTHCRNENCIAKIFH